MVELVINPDFYSILEVSCNASRSTIRDAYKRLALQVHPDKSSSSDATASFQILAKAWETLKDAERREEYDRFREGKRRQAEADDASRKQQRKRKRDDDAREAAAQVAKRQAQVEATRLAELSEVRRQAELHLSQIVEEHSQTQQRANARELHTRYSTRYSGWMKKWSAFQKRSEVIHTMKEIGYTKTIEQEQWHKLTAFETSAASELHDWDTKYPQGYLEQLKHAHAGRRAVFKFMMKGFRDRIDSSTQELENIGSKLMKEERSLREGMAEEALGFLKDPAWKRVHGDSIHGRQFRFWRLLKSRKVPARSLARSASECPTQASWRLEHQGSWLKVPIGEELCGRCDQRTDTRPKNLHYDAITLKCTHCQLLLCSQCNDNIRVLRKWEDWLRMPICLDSTFAPSQYPLL